VRFFISQQQLDGLVEAEAASLEGDVLAVPGRRLQAPVQPAVFFVREVEGKPDRHGLVGKVQTVEALAERGADHFRASVMLGEMAYDVVEGYLGLAPEGWTWPDGNGAAAVQAPVAVPAAMPAAMPAAVEADAGALTLTEPADDPGGLPAPLVEEATAAGNAAADALGEDIPVEVDAPRPSVPPPGEPHGLTGKRPALSPEARARISASPGFRAPSIPPPEPVAEPVRSRRKSRPPAGLSRLPSPTPGGGVRPSKPPPVPSPARARPSSPPRQVPVELPSEDVPVDEEPASPARSAEDLERILLETIRPTRGKRR
jgi:hypothetical protein